MPQLHFYVSEDVARELRQRARKRRLSLSRYLAETVQANAKKGWPPGFFQKVMGGWKGAPLERPPQGELEEREPP
jgi:hypothetical protein